MQRHHPEAQPAQRRGRVRIGRDHDALRAQGPAIGHDPGLAPRRDRPHLAALVHADACGERSRAQAAHELARIEGSAALLEHAEARAGGEPATPHLGLIEEGDLRPEPRRGLCRALEARALPRVHPGQHVSGRDVVAGDRVATDQLLGTADGAIGEAREGGRPRWPEEPKQRRKILADRRRQVSRVAPARARAAVIAFDERDVASGLAKCQRGRETREAAADHRDVRTLVAFEGRLRIRRRPGPEAPLEHAKAHPPSPRGSARQLPST
jgi:hypothetical protein